LSAVNWSAEGGFEPVSAGHGTEVFMLHGLEPVWEMSLHLRSRFTAGRRRRYNRRDKMVE